MALQTKLQAGLPKHCDNFSFLAFNSFVLHASSNLTLDLNSLVFGALNEKLSKISSVWVDLPVIQSVEPNTVPTLRRRFPSEEVERGRFPSTLAQRLKNLSVCLDIDYDERDYLSW